MIFNGQSRQVRISGQITARARDFKQAKQNLRMVLTGMQNTYSGPPQPLFYMTYRCRNRHRRAPGWS